ncbi:MULTISPECIES: hypothetical protein [unclassified Sphingomonas]|uniref:hypothetical protein n=1 Tax=unclassified Sphingomonas TaxID=196159 RepID=UPI0006F9740E|nr:MULTISPECIES: hypothetical protein [unclassified Sphingomonas]KQX18384.1 hypothetical protein ASD17_14580 [Sphingomonas sp. Root1294]KQY72291.1 hypothetical protein ASD39_20395 [Sphingomonas sp. Root50]KRB94438.1 hypothetical protein ASE22_00355 [Sphingomonas sp. Root720]
MNAPFALTETERARLNLAAHIADIARMDRELLSCTTANDPHGYRGAALENSILEAQAIVLAEERELTGKSLDLIAKACGL